MKIICFFLILVNISTNTLAQQKILRQVDNRIVYEKLDSFTKQARVKYFEIKPKKKRLYYWYWKNSFQKNYGGFEGSLLDGEYIVFDKEENLLEKANFKKGIIKGLYYYWNKNGILIKEEKWKHGVKTGYYKIYNNKAVLIEKGRNLKGKKNGISKKYIDSKVYKVLKYKDGKIFKDLTKEKKERQDVVLEKKKEKKIKKDKKKTIKKKTGK